VSDEEKEQVGSVGEEAAKLFSALQDWAKENGGEYADAAGGAAAGAASAMHAVNEHIATGSAECRYCPVCQVISAVREISPEVKQHLTSATASFVQALATAMATHADQGGQARRRGEGPVEKIDLDEDGEWEDDAWD
jgi:hypothetical protein